MPINEGLLHNWFFGNVGVRIAASLVGALLLGAIPFGRIVDWLFAGSENARSRSFRSAGHLAERAVPFFDALKAFVAVGIVAHGGGLLLGAAAMLAALVGHVASPWLRNRGPNDRAAGGVVAGALLALVPEAVTTLLWRRGG